MELRSLIEQAMSTRSTVTIPDEVRHPAPGETQYLEARVVPAVDNGRRLLGSPSWCPT